MPRVEVSDRGFDSHRQPCFGGEKFDPVEHFHHTVFALGGGTLFGLHTHTTNSGGTHPFSELNLGLDHIAFACTQSELEDWVARLDEAGIEHSGIKHAHYGSGISFRDPDNIALEFFAPPTG
ncbi:VOC family protein [Gordonia amicalis]|uniref:VOC family protein n=1 Tax=Gordonia amicalis TaxID=89053 RepID=UPI0035BE10C4